MRVLLPLLMILLSGCATEQRPPEDLLDRDTFRDLLVESHLLEARMNHEMVVEQKREVPMNAYYEEIFATHGTDRQQFERTFEYYASSPEQLNEIYEEVLAELGRRKDLPAQPADSTEVGPEVGTDTIEK